MNEEARRLGLARSHFANPTGLDAPGQVSTARELRILAEAALARPDFTRRIAMPHATVRTASGRTIEVASTNELLGRIAGVRGVKTGTTARAGECLVALADRDGHRVVLVLLGAKDRWWTAAALVEAAFREAGIVVRDATGAPTAPPDAGAGKPGADAPAAAMTRAASMRGGGGVVLLLTLAAYANAPWASFQFDDWNVILRDPAALSLSGWWSRMPGIRPLLKLSYAACAALGFGSFGFHVVNVVIHAGCVLLVFCDARSARAHPRRGRPRGFDDGLRGQPAVRGPSRADRGRDLRLRTVGVPRRPVRPRESRRVDRRARARRPTARVRRLPGPRGRGHRDEGDRDRRPAGDPDPRSLRSEKGEGGAARRGGRLAAHGPVVLAGLCAIAASPVYRRLLATSLAIRDVPTNLRTQATAIVVARRAARAPAPARRGSPAARRFLVDGRGPRGIAPHRRADRDRLRARPPPSRAGARDPLVLPLARTDELVPAAIRRRERSSALCRLDRAGLAHRPRVRPARCRAEATCAAAAATILAVAAALGAVTFTRNRVYSTEIGFWEDVVARAPHNARGPQQSRLRLRSVLPQGGSGRVLSPLAAALDPQDYSAPINLSMLRDGSLPGYHEACTGARFEAGSLKIRARAAKDLRHKKRAPGLRPERSSSEARGAGRIGDDGISSGAARPRRARGSGT
jgi:hypothetical protein